MLYISRDHYFLIKLGFGLCTNSRSELLALFSLLHVATLMGIPKIIVYGDSSMVINHKNGRCKLKVINLEHWCKRIDDIVKGFNFFNCQHIYREHNQLVDRLSKEDLVLTVGIFIVQESMEGAMIHEDTENLFFR